MERGEIRFYLPLPREFIWTYVGTYGDVITKFFRMDSLPNFLRYRAPRLRAPRLRYHNYTYGIFYIPANFAFNLPHYVTSYMHHTGKKEREKEKNK